MKLCPALFWGVPVWLLLMLPGCRTLDPWHDAVRISGEDARVAQWLEHFRAQAKLRSGLRAEGSLRIESGRGSTRVHEVVLAQRPARLRFESLDFLGQTRLLLVTDGEEFSFYNGRELSRGVVTANVLLDTLGLDLEPEEAVRLLLGAPLAQASAPTAGQEISAVLGWDDQRIIQLRSQWVHLTAQGELLEVRTLMPEGGIRWSARYGNWQSLPGGRFPMHLALEFPRQDLRAEIDFAQVELNPQLDSSLFRVPPPRVR